ncbi:hypothetical protein [Yinghuangia seranimata]|uniref:hypothetical protein n=1 Tax=Yinghuangia seranimata TaxID=408067 RepID=UPI00248CF53D|nr:hypothetical protein [Yinghuangia seranimata]MDI2132289.1 hypothetical protein [Yinghuangia seranimata]
MSYRPGRGTAALLGTAFAVCVSTLVLATFLLFPAGGCAGPDCGDAADPQVESVAEPRDTPGVMPETPPPAPPQAPPPSTPAAPGQDGTSLVYDTRVVQAGPADPGGIQVAPVGARILAGPFTVRETEASGEPKLVVMPMTRTAVGTLPALLVQDFRGSRLGWSLTATMSDFATTRGDKLGADGLDWQPRCAPRDGAGPYPSKAVPGSRTDKSRTALLCSTPSDREVTGGQFEVGGDFSLRLPASGVVPGSYTATLTLTLV